MQAPALFWARFSRATPSRYALADGPAAASAAKAKSVILLWMNGGPSHIDLDG